MILLCLVFCLYYWSLDQTLENRLGGYPYQTMTHQQTVWTKSVLKVQDTKYWKLSFIKYGKFKEFIIIGTGQHPKKGDIAEIHYSGKLPDGTKIDSSRQDENPLKFKVGIGHVLKGLIIFS